MKRLIKSGIEIEVCLNGNLINTHQVINSMMPKGWMVKGDGSLRSRGEFERPFLLEFVSKVSLSRNKFKENLQNFEKMDKRKIWDRQLKRSFKF